MNVYFNLPSMRIPRAVSSATNEENNMLRVLWASFRLKADYLILAAPKVPFFRIRCTDGQFAQFVIGRDKAGCQNMVKELVATPEVVLFQDPMAADSRKHDYIDVTGGTPHMHGQYQFQSPLWADPGESIAPSEKPRWADHEPKPDLKVHINVVGGIPFFDYIPRVDMQTASKRPLGPTKVEGSVTCRFTNPALWASYLRGAFIHIGGAVVGTAECPRLYPHQIAAVEALKERFSPAEWDPRLWYKKGSRVQYRNLFYRAERDIRPWESPTKDFGWKLDSSGLHEPCIVSAPMGVGKSREARCAMREALGRGEKVVVVTSPDRATIRDEVLNELVVAYQGRCQRARGKMECYPPGSMGRMSYAKNIARWHRDIEFITSMKGGLGFEEARDKVIIAEAKESARKGTIKVSVDGTMVAAFIVKLETGAELLEMKLGRVHYLALDDAKINWVEWHPVHPSRRG